MFSGMRKLNIRNEGRKCKSRFFSAVYVLSWTLRAIAGIECTMSSSIDLGMFLRGHEC